MSVQVTDGGQCGEEAAQREQERRQSDKDDEQDEDEEEDEDEDEEEEVESGLSSERAKGFDSSETETVRLRQSIGSPANELGIAEIGPKSERKQSGEVILDVERLKEAHTCDQEPSELERRSLGEQSCERLPIGPTGELCEMRAPDESGLGQRQMYAPTTAFRYCQSEGAAASSCCIAAGEQLSTTISRNTNSAEAKPEGVGDLEKEQDLGKHQGQQRVRGFSECRQTKLAFTSKRMRQYFESTFRGKPQQWGGAGGAWGRSSAKSMYQFFKCTRSELVACLLLTLMVAQSRISCRTFVSQPEVDAQLGAPRGSLARQEGQTSGGGWLGEEVAQLRWSGQCHLVSGLVCALAVATLTQIFGHVSGCHLLPSISWALYLKGHISRGRLLSYVCAQFAGAFLGLALLAALTSSQVQLEAPQRLETRAALARHLHSTPAEQPQTSPQAQWAQEVQPGRTHTLGAPPGIIEAPRGQRRRRHTQSPKSEGPSPVASSGPFGELGEQLGPQLGRHWAAWALASHSKENNFTHQSGGQAGGQAASSSPEEPLWREASEGILLSIMEQQRRARESQQFRAATSAGVQQQQKQQQQQQARADDKLQPPDGAPVRLGGHTEGPPELANNASGGRPPIGLGGSPDAQVGPSGSLVAAPSALAAAGAQTISVGLQNVTAEEQPRGPNLPKPLESAQAQSEWPVHESAFAGAAPETSSPGSRLAGAAHSEGQLAASSKLAEQPRAATADPSAHLINGSRPAAEQALHLGPQTKAGQWPTSTEAALTTVARTQPAGPPLAKLKRKRRTKSESPPPQAADSGRWAGELRTINLLALAMPEKILANKSANQCLRETMGEGQTQGDLAQGGEWLGGRAGNSLRCLSLSNESQMFIYQFLATLIVVLIYLINTDPRRTDLGFKSLSIGLGYFLAHLLTSNSGGFYGNPAHLLALYWFSTTVIDEQPQLTTEHNNRLIAAISNAGQPLEWQSHWFVYFLLPLLCGLFGALSHEYIDFNPLKARSLQLRRSFYSLDELGPDKQHNGHATRGAQRLASAACHHNQEDQSAEDRLSDSCIIMADDGGQFGPRSGPAVGRQDGAAARPRASHLGHQPTQHSHSGNRRGHFRNGSSSSTSIDSAGARSSVLTLEQIGASDFSLAPNYSAEQQQQRAHCNGGLGSAATTRQHSSITADSSSASAKDSAFCDSSARHLERHANGPHGTADSLLKSTNGHLRRSCTLASEQHFQAASDSNFLIAYSNNNAATKLAVGVQQPNSLRHQQGPRAGSRKSLGLQQAPAASNSAAALQTYCTSQFM